MTSRLVALLIAALAGALMALQGSLNSALGKLAGLWEATFLVQITGTLLAVGLLPLVGDGSLKKLWSGPWYTWLGGVLGVAIVFTVAASIPKVGVASATTAIIVAQVLTACIIDHFGLFGLQPLPFTWWRWVGGALLAAGGWFLLRQ
ncbi:MAG: DMT family transporter [Firmicutes bacterium]|nr:DMT family transporter [Bacillota bacterium]